MSHFSHFAMRKWHRPSGHVRSTVTADSCLACLADQAHNWRCMLGQDVKPQSAATRGILLDTMVLLNTSSILLSITKYL